jgi:Protein of unknown function (DUF992)
MVMLKKSLLAVAGLAFGTLAVATPSRAAVTVEAGMLSCHVGSGFGFVFGSSRDLNCTYSGRGRVEHYTGTVQKYGVDIGYLQSGVLLWAVLAPTTDPGAGALSGVYGGATVGASAVVGGEGNVLVGGSGHGVSLQAISIQGDKGINVAAGIEGISLTLQP